jgi:hypothetical protein
MISSSRKEELVNSFAYYMERYLDKQWIDDEAKVNSAETEEELKFLRECVTYSVVCQY